MSALYQQLTSNGTALQILVFASPLDFNIEPVFDPLAQLFPTSSSNSSSLSPCSTPPSRTADHFTGETPKSVRERPLFFPTRSPQSLGPGTKFTTLTCPPLP